MAARSGDHSLVAGCVFPERPNWTRVRATDLGKPTQVMLLRGTFGKTRLRRYQSLKMVVLNDKMPFTALFSFDFRNMKVKRGR